MSSAVNRALGDSVKTYPAGGAEVVIRGIFREEPVEVLDSDGNPVLTIGPSLQIQKPDIGALIRDDVIDPDNSKTYRVTTSWPSGSPASDAFVVFDLERIT